MYHTLVWNSNTLRLCIHILLCGEWEGIVAFLAIVCSSWVPVNRHSTMRSLLTPLGNEDYPSVRRSNKLTARTCSSVEKASCISLV